MDDQETVLHLGVRAMAATYMNNKKVMVIVAVTVVAVASFFVMGE